MFVVFYCQILETKKEHKTAKFMKTPTWAIITAILMILFGLFSILTSLQGIKTTNPAEPMGEMLDTLKNQPLSFPDSVVYHMNDSTFTINYDSLFTESGEIFGMMDKFVAMSDETIAKLKKSYKWSLGFSIVFVFGGIILFWRNRFSPALAIATTALFILSQMNILSIILKSGSGFLSSISIVLQALFYFLVAITCLCLVCFSKHGSYKMNKAIP